MNYLLTENALTVYVDKHPITIRSTDERWDRAIDLLRNGEEGLLIDLMQPAKLVQKYVDQSCGAVALKNGAVTYKDEPLPPDWPIVRRILAMAAKQLPIEPLANFLSHVMFNPSHRAVRDLIEFVDYGQLPLTSDGHFLAYKKVRADYKDLHSKSFDNSIGQVVHMPRNRVDEDPERTCSSGLHVCSYDYLAHFGGNLGDGYRVVVCKISPADVVAVPKDYSNTKMRVCRYEVIDELEEDANLLADKWVWGLVDKAAPKERWCLEHSIENWWLNRNHTWVDSRDAPGVLVFDSEASADEYMEDLPKCIWDLTIAALYEEDEYEEAEDEKGWLIESRTEYEWLTTDHKWVSERYNDYVLRFASEEDANEYINALPHALGRWCVPQYYGDPDA
jgi:hypothetical protein